MMEKSLQHFSSLFEHNPDAITSVDLDGKLTSVNKAAEVLSGYTSAELLQMSIWDILTEEYVKAERDILLHDIRHGNRRTFICNIMHKDGSIIDLKMSVLPIIVENEVVGQYGIMKNITEDLKTKKALALVEQDFKETVRLQQGMIFKFQQIGDRFIHTMCDGELMHTMGLTQDQIVGKDLFQFVPKERAERKTEYYRRAWNGESVLYESTGNGVTYLASLKPVIRDGQVLEVIASCVDITERKRVEEALRKSEAHYRLIAENVLDIIQVIDTDGIIKYASPSHLVVTGYDPESLIGSSYMAYVHPDHSAQVRINFAQMIQNKQSSEHEYLIIHQNGSSMLLDIKGMPVLNNSGEVEKVVVVGRDITERRRTEEMLRNSDKLSVLGELAAGIAHEIRNPLTALKGFIQLLQHESNGSTKYLDVMLSEIDRITIITSELLMLAKPQAIHFKRHALAPLLHSVITIMEPQANLKNVRLVAELSLDLPHITCEEMQMKQVFINIIKNGIEAMPDGGSLVISASPSKEGNTVLIRFTDEGCGIPTELINKLGQPFYSTKEKGTGLGLMVSYKIIKDHQGKISIFSNLNEGTDVIVELPLAADLS